VCGSLSCVSCLCVESVGCEEARPARALALLLFVCPARAPLRLPAPLPANPPEKPLRMDRGESIYLASVVCAYVYACACACTGIYRDSISSYVYAACLRWLLRL